MSLLNNDMKQFDSRFYISKKFKLNQNFPYYIQRAHTKLPTNFVMAHSNFLFDFVPK